MSDLAMPTLPVPVFASVALAWLLLRAVLRREGPAVFLALLALCAVQAMLTAFAMHYGLAWAGFLRPITAAVIPPLAWVAFNTTALRGFEPRDGLHLLGPAFVAFCRLFVPGALDLVIPALFLGYGAAILWVLAKRDGDLPRLGLGAGVRPGQVWRLIGLALIGSAASDAAIVGAQVLGQGHLVPWIVSIASSLTLALVGALALTPDLQPDPDEAPTESRAPDAETAAVEADLLDRLGRLLTAERLYLDPDLTLNRLARRLHVPAKRLSEAINRQTGGNTARYINGFRIRAACEALATGQSVTEAMFVAGFNTKSNFNRAFLLATGKSPSDWRSAPPLHLPPPQPTLTP